MRQVTQHPMLIHSNVLSKLPVRQVTDKYGRLFEYEFSKLPVRQVTTKFPVFFRKMKTLRGIVSENLFLQPLLRA